MEITQSEQQAKRQVKKKKKNESNIWDLWYKTERVNLHVTEIPEETEKGTENAFEEMIAENSPNQKETDIQVQETQQSTKQDEPNRPILWHYN